MGYHVHQRTDGKFNLWSTVVDDYVLDKWLSEKEFVKDAVGFLELDVQRIIEKVESQVENAKKDGCSAYLPIRCSREEIEKTRRAEK